MAEQPKPDIVPLLAAARKALASYRDIFGRGCWNTADHAAFAKLDAEIRRADPLTLYCSFCGKSQHEVGTMVAGPKVFVCDECVDLCADVVREAREQRAKEAPANG